MPRKYTGFAEGFYQKVHQSGGCYEWRGATRGGRFNQYGNYRGRMAHRVAWELGRGLIPEGMCVLHRCDNPKCVKLDHLFLGSLSDNARDMVDKGRHGMAVLNWDLVEEIRALHKQGHVQRRLAEKYGVSPACICNIVKGNKWTARASGE